MTDAAASSAPTRVTIVEDHGLLAESLGTVLAADGLEVDVLLDRPLVEVAETVTDDPPDLVLLDLDLGDEVTSLPIIPRLVAVGTLVVMLTGATDRIRLAECVEAGAVGVVAKGAPFERLRAAIDEALSRRTLFAPGERDALLRELREHRQERDNRLKPFGALTPKERALLGELIEGRTAEQIAERWVVSLSTVRHHIRGLLSKLEVRSQLAAVAMALRAGWRPDS